MVGYWFGEETDDGGDIGGVVTLTVTSVSYIVVGYWFGEETDDGGDNGSNTNSN